MGRKLKVVYLSGSRVPVMAANGVHVQEMCKALVGLGVDVTLHAAKEVGPPQNKKNAEIGIRGIRTRLFRRPRVRLFGAVLFGLRSALAGARIGPDLVYARCLYSAFFFSFFNIPLIYESHHPPNNWFQSKLEQRVVTSENCVLHVVITNSLRAYYERLERRRSRAPLFVAPDGADIPEVDKTGDYFSLSDIRNGHLVAGYFGSGMPGKGVDIVVAMARKTPDVEFRVFGVSLGEARVLALEPPRNVKFYGRVDHSKVLAWMRSCHCFLLPNQADVIVGGRINIGAYTSPLKMFEYMAAGRPIIASDLSVIREVLRDQENALLVPPADAHAWARALRRIESDPEYAEGLARSAFCDLRENYTWDKRARNIVCAALEHSQNR